MDQANRIRDYAPADEPACLAILAANTPKFFGPAELDGLGIDGINPVKASAAARLALISGYQRSASFFRLHFLASFHLRSSAFIGGHFSCHRKIA